MNNNDIFKKLRVALQLRDDQIVEILALVDFRMSKGEIGNFFRNADHPNYMECGDQVLRNFLNGLVIHLRGTKENPKNAMEVINKNQEEVRQNVAAKKTVAPSPSGTKKPTPKKAADTKNKPSFKAKKPVKKIEIVEKVAFKNGKKKS